MEQYQIEKDVPMPNGYGSKYSILKRMKKGDSIVIGTGFVAAMRQAAKAWDIKIATRRENLNHHRIWRAN